MKNNHGFTLIEIMIAVAILAIIAGIAIPAYNGYIRQSRFAEAQNEFAKLKIAQSEFFLENNTYFGPVANGGDFAAASNDMYTTVPADTKFFDFAVSNAPCGDFTQCYRITATGKGDMTGETVTFDGP